MERKNVKKILYEMGASTELLEMPAVMERIYNYYATSTEEEFKNELDVGADGEIIFSKADIKIRDFKQTENGEVIFENYEDQGIEARGKYIIDKYGMDRKFIDDELELFEKTYSVIRDDEGFIEVNGNKKFAKDEGDPILNYYNYTTLKSKPSRSIGWDGNRDFLTKYYPITKEWFAMREGILEKSEEEEVVEQEKDPEVQNLKNRLKTIQGNYEELERQYANLKEENSELVDKQARTQIMLKRTLEVCESVNRSPIGKVFFGRKLKQLPQAPDGDER